MNLQRINGTGGAVTVSYRTLQRTVDCDGECDDATEGSDFQKVTDLSTTMSPGISEASFVVPFYDDHR